MSLRLTCLTQRDLCQRGKKVKNDTKPLSYRGNPSSLDAEAGGFLGFPQIWPIDELQDQTQN